MLHLKGFNEGSVDKYHNKKCYIVYNIYILCICMYTYTHIWDTVSFKYLYTQRLNDVLIKQIFSSHLCHHSKEGKKPRTKAIFSALLALNHQIPCDSEIRDRLTAVLALAWHETELRLPKENRKFPASSHMSLASLLKLLHQLFLRWITLRN